uniref:BROMI C-terminal Rab TBC-like domain-containing protein n=1 Tax=Timema genevievae TaxID=629358 RepID=A0A7R9PP04_TIMGE|nr:unnamed protein product [Timema genevievae]
MSCSDEVQLISTLSALPEIFGIGEPIKSQNQPSQISVVALLSERDDESSDETLVEFVGPTKLSELLTFESCVEPWHYVGLLTLRLLTSDLNVCLYLSNKLNFQDHLLKLQSENTINSEFDNSTLNSSCDETDMIIDAHSLLRHQILVATYVVGGPSERTLPSTELYEELDGEESVPFLFSSYPPPQPYFKKAEVSPKTQTELHKFLKETRHGPHDSGWLLHARKAYRLSCHNDIKPLVLLDLFYQTAKCFYSDVTHQVDWSNVIPDTLFPAELEGIQLTIRYGVNCGLLQARPQNFDNLAYLLKQSHGSNGTPSSFEGFDWFLATAFLVSGGNLDRCYLLLNNIICLPTSKYMWSNNHSFESDSTFGHLLECVVSAELPQCFAALQLLSRPSSSDGRELERMFKDLPAFRDLQCDFQLGHKELCTLISEQIDSDYVDVVKALIGLKHKDKRSVVVAGVPAVDTPVFLERPGLAADMSLAGVMFP